MVRAILIAALAALPLAAQAAPPRPKLIVAISVDQFSSEVFARYRKSYRHGLRTLSRGIAYPVGYQSHAATETCPGHSTILTGRHPAGTGIVANTWFDIRTQATVYCVSVPGADKAARGPQNMRVTTLGDWIKAVQPGARTFAVAGKDRAAITMAGKQADGVYWWADAGGFTTSAYAGPTGDRTSAFNSALAAKWTASPPQLWPQASKRCAALVRPGHFGDLDLSGGVPPELARGVTEGPGFPATKAFNDALRTSPSFDAAIADFALDLIARENLGRGPATDVLAIGLSATDYIGHRLGNGGAEMCVQQAALDATIGRLLTAIRALKVPVIVVLTADHGSTDAAEREHDHDASAARIDDRGLMRKLNDTLQADLALTAAPLDTDDPQQLFVKAGPDAAQAARIRDAAIDWLKGRPAVRAVFTRAEVEAAAIAPGTAPDRLTLIQRYRESYDPERSGDIAVAYAERASFGIPKKVGDTIAGHGSPWDHDRQVPILFWWPGARAANRDQPAETVDIAPTLAAVAGIEPPVPVDGRCLNLGEKCPE